MLKFSCFFLSILYARNRTVQVTNTATTVITIKVDGGILKGVDGDGVGTGVGAVVLKA